MTVSEGSEGGKTVDMMGVRWSSEKKGVYIGKFTVPGHRPAWEQGLWQGCEPMNIIPGLTPNSHHLQGDFTSPPKQARGSRWAGFWTRTTGTTPHVHQCLQTSTHFHLPFLTWALETVSIEERSKKTKLMHEKCLSRNGNLKELGWCLHSFHYHSLIPMRNSWSLPSGSSQSWGTCCSMTPESGNKDEPKALCMEKGGSWIPTTLLAPIQKYFLARCTCIDSSFCTQMKLCLFSLVRLCLSSVPWPSGHTKTQRTMYVYNLKGIQDIILSYMFFYFTNWVPES